VFTEMAADSCLFPTVALTRSSRILAGSIPVAQLAFTVLAARFLLHYPDLINH
jgi:hypothetical protein